MEHEAAMERERIREAMESEATEREIRCKIARARLDKETAQFEPFLREYLETIISNEDRMNRAATVMHRLDRDPKMLSQQSGIILKGVLAVEESDDDSEYDPNLELESEKRSVDRAAAAIQSIPFHVIPPNPKVHSLMQWKGFKPHPISKDTDILGDRQKSWIALFQELCLGFSVGGFGGELSGFFGILAKAFMPCDYRAFYKAAAARIILLPESLPEPDESQVADYERNLLGISHYQGNSSMMTCLTYTHDHMYGTITLFNANVERTKYGDWPTSVTPMAVMTKIPKKMLQKLAKSVPHSKRTKLEIKNTKGTKKWSIRSSQRGTEPTSVAPVAVMTKVPRKMLQKFVKSVPHFKRTKLQIKNRKGTKKWSIASAQHDTEWPAPAHDRGSRVKELSIVLEQALGEDCSDHPSPRPNAVLATIPEMIAWLHGKASYLKEIKTGELYFIKNGGYVERVGVECAKGPDPVAHEGVDPSIVVIHPDKGDWVTRRIYWS